MKTLTAGAVVTLVAAMAATGCVSKGRYDAAVAQTKSTEKTLAQKNLELDRVSSDRARLSSDRERLSSDLASRRAEVEKLKAQIAELSTSSTQARTASGARIAELQKRLGVLEAAQQAAEARAALYKDLSLRLKKQIDDGDLTLTIRDGRMVLRLPNDVLFDSGRTELKPAGMTALEAVAAVMRAMPERAFQVAGHTDNVPIHTAQFMSNWELSSGRALRVVHFLIDKGVDPTVLSAAGYGEVDPVGANDSADGRRQNRRTEITLQPNIDELVNVPK